MPNYITSYRSTIDTIAVNCLVFLKIAFLHFSVNIQDGGSLPSWILGVPLECRGNYTATSNNMKLVQ